MLGQDKYPMSWDVEPRIYSVFVAGAHAWYGVIRWQSTGVLGSLQGERRRMQNNDIEWLNGCEDIATK